MEWREGILDEEAAFCRISDQFFDHVEFIGCDGCGRSTHDDHACGCYECNVNFCPDCTHTHLVRDVDGLLCHECS